MTKPLPQIILKVGFDFHWDIKKVWALNYPVEEMAMQAANIGINLVAKQPIITNDKSCKHIPRLVKRESTSFKTS